MKFRVNFIKKRYDKKKYINQFKNCYIIILFLNKKLQILNNKKNKLKTNLKQKN